MSQALGLRGDQKYQEIGCRASLGRVADAFRKTGDGDSLERLLRMMTLTVHAASQ